MNIVRAASETTSSYTYAAIARHRLVAIGWMPAKSVNNVAICDN